MTSCNRLRFAGNPSIHATFKGISAIVPMRHINGAGHQETVRLSLIGGGYIELSQATALYLIDKLPQALAGFPDLPDCSGSFTDMEGDQ